MVFPELLIAGFFPLWRTLENRYVLILWNKMLVPFVTEQQAASSEFWFVGSYVCCTINVRIFDQTTLVPASDTLEESRSLSACPEWKLRLSASERVADQCHAGAQATTTTNPLLISTKQFDLGWFSTWKCSLATVFLSSSWFRVLEIFKKQHSWKLRENSSLSCNFFFCFLFSMLEIKWNARPFSGYNFQSILLS